MAEIKHREWQHEQPNTQHRLVPAADRMVAAGILCILNYTSTTLYVPENVRVQSIDPLLHLYQLTYHLAPETEKSRQSYQAGVNISNVKKGRTG